MKDMPDTVLAVHRLSALELIYRSTYQRRSFGDEDFQALRHDLAELLAQGHTVGIKARLYGDSWAYCPFVCRTPAAVKQATEREMP